VTDNWECWFQTVLPEAGLAGLLPLKNFVDCSLAALVDADHFVDRLETSKRDIHDVIPRSQHDFDGRHLVEQPAG